MRNFETRIGNKFFDEMSEVAITNSRRVVHASTLFHEYARAARIFLKLKRPESRMKMVGLATERMPQNSFGAS